MSNDKKRELERLDPESVDSFKALATRNVEEFAARVAVGDAPFDTRRVRRVSELIVDAVLD